MRRPEHGFTLLETLVMLVVSSLAIMMMFQALGGFNQSRERIGALEGVRNNDAVVLGWLRDNFRGVVAIEATPGVARQPDDPAAGLRGTADGFTALTLAPLLGQAGAPVQVQWRIATTDSGSALIYQEAGREPLTLPLRDASELRFAYLDASGVATAQWPPQAGLQTPLPSAIELVLGRGAQTRVIAQAIATPRPMQLAPYTVVGEDD